VPECEHKFIQGRNGNGLCDKHEDQLQALIFFLAETDVLDVVGKLRQARMAKQHAKASLLGPDGRPIKIKP